MVRLFVPEGEGQHELVRGRPGALPATRETAAIPQRSCLAAAGITTFLAIAGRSRPGIFLKCAAVFTTFDLTYTTFDSYGRRELNRIIFMVNEIEPKPGKLWERTKHWTVEDATLTGGGLGIFTALNPRALPGVSGWRRFMGSAIIGAAFGSFVGEKILVRIPPHFLNYMDATDRNTRRAQYDFLQQNEPVKATLSFAGRLSLAMWTWSPPWLPKSRTGSEAGMKMGGARGGAQPGALESQFPALQQSQDTITFTTEFDKEELMGADINEGGYRVYFDDLQSRDAKALEHHIDHLQELKKNLVLEARYVWQTLARKESAFYNMVEENDEKDLYRRELQLLNSVGTQIISREAILTYHIADARKQLAQINHSGSSPSTAPTLSEPLQTEVRQVSDDQFSPHITANNIRKSWMRQKEILASMEQILAHYDAIDVHTEPAVDAQVAHIREEVDYLTKNVEATGRLLSEFEEQVRRAEEDTRK